LIRRRTIDGTEWNFAPKMDDKFWPREISWPEPAVMVGAFL